MVKFNPFSIDDDSENEGEFSESQSQNTLTNDLNDLLSRGLAPVNTPSKDCAVLASSTGEDASSAEVNEKVQGIALPEVIPSFSTSMFYKPSQNTDPVLGANEISSPSAKNESNPSGEQAVLPLGNNLTQREDENLSELNKETEKVLLPSGIPSFSQSMLHNSSLKKTRKIHDEEGTASDKVLANDSLDKDYENMDMLGKQAILLPTATTTTSNTGSLSTVDTDTTDDRTPEEDTEEAISLTNANSENIAKKTTVSLPALTFDTVLPSLSSSSILQSTAQRTATLSDGRIINLRRKIKNNRIPEGLIQDDVLPNRDDNFGIPINSLLSSIEAERVIQTNEPKRASSQKPNVKGVLWTEKWRPKSWIDLMGNERTHRQLLAWLKQWSKCVFNEESVHDGSGFDPLGRPDRKILLIHGPPGIGKTTIAHVIARQAGYEVLEINASDERSGTQVKDKIIGATESHRVDDNRPVCIIADEIEGSSEAGFIRTLVEMINSDKKACENMRNGVGSTKATKGKKKKKNKLLLRPIIAICNDVYANSLRTLRPLAEVIQYKRVPPSMMITKLKQICAQEKVSVDTKKLTEVVNQVEGDMRSALNILQFGKSKDNASQKKDVNVGWSNIVNRVFHRGSGLSREEEANKLLALTNMSGEYDKLVSGCFSLYPEMQYHDDMVSKPGKIGDWLFFFDELTKGVYQNQHFQLEEYLGQPVLAFYSLFNSTTNVQNMRPKSDFEHFQAKNASMEFITQLLNKVPARISQMFKKADVSMELAPYLMRILSPNVQPVNMSLVKTIEKEQMANSAAVAFSLNIRLNKDKIDSATIYRLDPPLELLAYFGEERQNTNGVGRFSVRQLLCQEIYQEKLRNIKREHEEIHGETPKDASSGTVTKKRKLDSGVVLLEKKDFFGRVISIKEDSDLSRESSPAGSTGTLSRVWIQYNEGFSNAVRKNITWDELWAM